MKLDYLLFYPPKQNNFYRLYGDRMFVMYMAMGLLAIADCVHQRGFRTQIVHLGIERIKDPHFSLGGRISRKVV